MRLAASSLHSSSLMCSLRCRTRDAKAFCYDFSVLSIPATWGGEVVATLNLYSRSGPFDETAGTIARLLAAQVAIAVSRSPEFAASRAVVEQGQRDAEDQANVNMATGLLMINEACTAEQAEGLLREAAANSEQTVLEIAQRIIEQHRHGR